ncbi:MAG: (d)CMP kinase [Candidatus Omnitrophica bacterium]|nr:(d)CMP kinase [Candidatus Omnitrophota bacterium]
MIIAIDGPAGAGKSTIAKLLADKLGFLYVDTGAMYRALTLKVLRLNADFEDIEKLIEIAFDTNIRLKKSEGHNSIVSLDGEDVTALIRKPEVTNAVFHVASISLIRNLMVKFQREYAQSDSIVMEGRDIGTVVFPKAQRKFYLNAKVKVRALRRKLEFEQRGIKINIEDIVKQIEDRDSKDKTRDCGPLKRAEDAVYIDTSDMNIQEVVNCLFTYIKNEKKK